MAKKVDHRCWTRDGRYRCLLWKGHPGSCKYKSDETPHRCQSFIDKMQCVLPIDHGDVCVLKFAPIVTFLPIYKRGKFFPARYFCGPPLPVK